MTLSQKRYSAELGMWLGSFEWTHWATFTSRPIVRQVAKRTGRYVPVISDQDSISSQTRLFKSSAPTLRMYRRGMTNYARRISPVRMYWGTEAGKVTGRIHCHSLICLPETTAETEESLWRLGFRMFGRTHVEKYEPDKGAHHYIGKYVTKTLADYDLWTYGNHQTPNH